ncbi:MAG: TadE/TadG family type IV pilus assembly protein [Rubripirellula sp.]
MKRNLKKNGREGTAMVEFAIVAPLLFLLFFASFEFCRVAMIRHTADNAVYEGCRVGIVPGATSGEVQAEAQRVLATIGVTDATIAVTPNSFDRETEEVTVRVTVPLDSNTFVPNQFVGGRSVIRELTLSREGV